MQDKSSLGLRNRRGFIRQAACAALGTTALASAIRDLRFMNAAMAQTGVQDYKALVCLFLQGGNDSNNLVIPTINAEYNNYATIRTPILAIPQASLLPVAPLKSDGHEYGLHPACPELQTLFGEGKLAMLFNTGTLVYPVTRAEFESGSMALPPQLFSHADQITQWQTSIPDRPPTSGWGGRCADLMAAVEPGAPVSLSVTLAGSNTFEVGSAVSQYSVSTDGAIALSAVTGARLAALTNVLGLPYPNLQAAAYSKVAMHSIESGALLNKAIIPTASATYWTTPFPATIKTPTSGTTFGSALSPQLKMIARLIEAGNRPVSSGGFGMRRQIFFCQVGGFDTHTNQTTANNPESGSHANLLAEVSQCALAFQRAMEQLGLAKQVTLFTCSDFGRTFPSNGQGSDHGWGSHHLILGGAVKGQQTYGTFPVLTVNGPDDTSTGRWIPSTACDQYFATLASWFGVDKSNLATVFPNLGRFSTPNLGFV